MESHENHNVVLDEVMRTFTKSSKLTKQGLKDSLIGNYLKDLENKEQKKKEQEKFELEIVNPSFKKIQGDY